ncbi:MAG: type II secretion system protein GspG [Dehalococcoidia bacterium]
MQPSQPGEPGSGDERTFQLDLRAIIPVAVLAIVVLTIIFLNLHGREGVEVVTQPAGPSPTLGPTPTPGPSPTPGPLPTIDPAQQTATAELAAGGSGRDQQRQLDLAAVSDALEAYRVENGDYPSTNNNVQTLCVFAEDDAGCALIDFLDPIPLDPRGEPVNNGYFYQSDGQAFALYALRESDVLPECTNVPQHLSAYDSLLCLRGPVTPQETP